MRSDPAHISQTEPASAARRPWRSAYRPSNQLPTGRMKKPTAKTAAVLRSWAVASPLGKKLPAK